MSRQTRSRGEAGPGLDFSGKRRRITHGPISRILQEEEVPEVIHHSPISRSPAVRSPAVRSPSARSPARVRSPRAAPLTAKRRLQRANQPMAISTHPMAEHYDSIPSVYDYDATDPYTIYRTSPSGGVSRYLSQLRSSSPPSSLLASRASRKLRASKGLRPGAPIISQAKKAIPRMTKTSRAASLQLARDEQLPLFIPPPPAPPPPPMFIPEQSRYVVTKRELTEAERQVAKAREEHRQAENSYKEFRKGNDKVTTEINARILARKLLEDPEYIPTEAERMTSGMRLQKQQEERGGVYGAKRPMTTTNTLGYSVPDVKRVIVDRIEYGPPIPPPRPPAVDISGMHLAGSDDWDPKSIKPIEVRYRTKAKTQERPKFDVTEEALQERIALSKAKVSASLGRLAKLIEEDKKQTKNFTETMEGIGGPSTRIVTKGLVEAGPSRSARRMKNTQHIENVGSSVWTPINETFNPSA